MKRFVYVLLAGLIIVGSMGSSVWAQDEEAAPQEPRETEEFTPPEAPTSDGENAEPAPPPTEAPVADGDVTFVCPKCGTTDSAAGMCSSCEVPLMAMRSGAQEPAEVAEATEPAETAEAAEPAEAADCDVESSGEQAAAPSGDEASPTPRRRVRRG